MSSPEAPGPVVLKKYGNRRLYDTRASRYVTLEDVATMVKDGVDILVRDAATDEDLTRLVLLQIILEHQKSRVDLLPVAFLRQLISYKEDTLKQFFERYLSLSLEVFAGAQDQVTRGFRASFENALKGMPPLNPMEWPKLFQGAARPQAAAEATPRTEVPERTTRSRTARKRSAGTAKTRRRT